MLCYQPQHVGHSEQTHLQAISSTPNNAECWIMQIKSENMAATMEIFLEEITVK